MSWTTGHSGRPSRHMGARPAPKETPQSAWPSAPPRPSPAPSTSQPHVTAPEGWGSVHGPSRECTPRGRVQTQALSQPGGVGGAAQSQPRPCNRAPVSPEALRGTERFSHRNSVTTLLQVKSGHVGVQQVPHKTVRPAPLSGRRFQSLKVRPGIPRTCPRALELRRAHCREPGSVTQSAYASPAYPPASVLKLTG